MKKIITTLVIMICFFAGFAQKDVTTFLGIPVDGYVPEMRKQLIAKGFSPQKYLDEEYFTGEFNGTKVRVYIVTNNNKVYRIMLCDDINLDEADIKIRYNRLVRQFENNNRYISTDSYTIADDEDIAYEMLVHNKKYQAVYFQNPEKEKWDTLAIQEKMRSEILKKYTEEQLQNPTEEISEDIQNLSLNYAFEIISKKPVWFCITERLGMYSIAMYYDNEYNHANGEDL